MRLAAVLLSVLLPMAVQAEIRADPIDWTVDDTRFSGFLVYDDDGESKPGIVMVPNWMGVNESAVGKARAIAESGYVVLLADVYGADLRPANAQEAAKAAGAQYADLERLRRRVAAAVDLLRAQVDRLPVRPDHVAAIGFCFGGSAVLELARSGYDIPAVVSFHGGLKTTLPAGEGVVRSRVLVLNGADDTYVDAEEVAGFESEMRAAGVDWQFVNFAGAVHCFAEADANSPGCTYHERSAKRAYRMMDDFFAEVF